MVSGVPPSVAAFVFLAVAAGGVVTGLDGFGFAVVGTSLLALVVDPGTAVTLMILPILGANVSLVRELDAAGLRSCVRRFWPFVAAAAVGTVAGMSLLSVVPTRPLLVGLGVFVLSYVAFAQSAVTLPGEAWLREVCFSPGTAAKAGFGLVAGAVFGVSNVGVQVTAYLESLELDRSTFVGVVAMVFLGISSVRVVTATALGLYADAGGGTLLLSVAAVVPGLVGVAAGARLRRRLPEGPQRTATFLLLAVIGGRLVAGGAGLL